LKFVNLTLKSLKLLAVKSDDENDLKSRNLLTHSQNRINFFITDTYKYFDHFGQNHHILWFFSTKTLNIWSIGALFVGRVASA